MKLVDRLAAAVDGLWPSRRVLVAVDGPDAAGKTTLANALAQRAARPTVRASIDDWHRSRDVRLRRGDLSPVGYYEDSFDYDALTAHLLHPFRGGATRVRTAQFNVKSDERADAHAERLPDAAALLFDGVFLLRPELQQLWDLTIYLHVPPAVTLARAMRR